jgi:hypothetical protein
MLIALCNFKARIYSPFSALINGLLKQPDPQFRWRCGSAAVHEHGFEKHWWGYHEKNTVHIFARQEALVILFR